MWNKQLEAQWMNISWIGCLCIDRCGEIMDFCCTWPVVENSKIEYVGGDFDFFYLIFWKAFRVSYYK